MSFRGVSLGLRFYVVCGLFALTSISGRAAVPFQIDGTDLQSGSPAQVSTQGKKGMVVLFLSSTCPCSNSHLKELKSLAETYKDFSFVAIHSNADESVDQAKTYFTRAALPFTVLQDNKDILADHWKAFKTPHAFVVSNQGETLYRGGVTDSRDLARAQHFFLREALADIENNRPVKVSEGRTLGCVISRGEQNVW